MTNTTESLSEQIEQLVREHIEASRRAAAAAVERAFASDTTGLRSQPARARTRTPGRRRATTEVAALGERLYQAVCTQPGEAMAVLGPALGKTPRELHRPMMVLKRAGRVRSVGQRHQTRYFPAVVRSA
jgi:hypothetical protein